MPLKPVTDLHVYRVPGFDTLQRKAFFSSPYSYISFVNPLLFASCTDTVKLLEA
jgi:hypothetical protein